MREALGGLVSCLGTAAMLYGIFPQLLGGRLGSALLGGAALFAILALVIGVRQGVGFPRSVAAVMFVAALAILGGYGPMWYVTVHLAGMPLWGVPTP